MMVFNIHGQKEIASVFYFFTVFYQTARSGIVTDMRHIDTP